MCTRFYADIDKELKPIITAAQQVSFAQQMMISLSRPLSMSGEIRSTDNRLITPCIELQRKLSEAVPVIALDLASL